MNKKIILTLNREEVKKLIEDKYNYEVIQFTLSSSGFKGYVKG